MTRLTDIEKASWLNGSRTKQLEQWRADRGLDPLNYIPTEAMRHIESLEQRITALEGALKEVLDCITKTAPDDLERRDWLSYGCWMHPGDALAEIDAATLKQAQAALAGEDKNG